MNDDSDYLSEREKYFPQNFDHIEERIKIRLLAQKNFAFRSEAIEKMMTKTCNWKHKKYNMPCFETSHL